MSIYPIQKKLAGIPFVYLMSYKLWPPRAHSRMSVAQTCFYSIKLAWLLVMRMNFLDSPKHLRKSMNNRLLLQGMMSKSSLLFFTIWGHLDNPSCNRSLELHWVYARKNLDFRIKKYFRSDVPVTLFSLFAWAWHTNCGPLIGRSAERSNISP